MKLVFFLQCKENRNYGDVFVTILYLSYKYELKFTKTAVLNVAYLFKRLLSNLSKACVFEKEKLLNLEVEDLLEFILLASFKLGMISQFEEKFPNIVQLVRNGKLLATFTRRSEILPLLSLIRSILTRGRRIMHYTDLTEDITGEGRKFALAISSRDGKTIERIKKRFNLF